MKSVGFTERSRRYAEQHYIEPARQRGDREVRITAGDIHKALGFRNRVPAVCQALQSRKFLEENGLELERIEGPPSGQSTTVTFTYQLKPAGGRPQNDDIFLRLRGIGKSIFADLGGGEVFLKKERENFFGPGPHA